MFDLDFTLGVWGDNEACGEINFSFDGLRNDQLVLIKRYSLVSLLSICPTRQQRRLLRSQGLFHIVAGLDHDTADLNLDTASFSLSI
ncbi:unnamed protein product [Vicia faba]|uniref:Wings apart-like protein C-terminal domain-containing protein n=1 Tax=Vicia faba TaxID=3906 RepID=A0AAV0ZLH1_VICFA|nr:unnamed protein product [Vicia faba]